MRAPWKVGVLSLVGLGVAGAIVVVACLPDPERPPTTGKVGAIPCDAGGPGNLPPPNCDPTPGVCPSSADPACVIASHCGDPATCMPFTDNATNPNKTLDFRLRRLFVTAPPALTAPVIQGAIVAAGVNLNAPECAESGKGSFNWLLRIDKTAKTLQTGGAPASTDPFGLGFCFFQASVGTLAVGPVTAKLDFANDNQFSSQAVDQLNVPIFVDPTNLKSVVILPIKKAVVQNVTISSGGNCIGGFNKKAVETAACTDHDPDSCSRWATAGDIGGFITLEDADSVNIDLLQESLCVLLTGSTKDPAHNNGCQRTNGKLNFKGDFCSTSQKPGDCQDAFWLSATFAASAVKINDGAGINGCGVTQTPDAGPDASGDASKDATGD